MKNSRNDALILQTAGGLISPPLLRLVAETAHAHGCGVVHATARQELAIPGLNRARARDLWSQLPNERFCVSGTPHEPNIVTTAPVAGLQPGRAWLSTGIFQDLLAAIPFRPRLPVSISDPSQPWLPCRAGTINFLAGEKTDTWSVVVRLPGSNWTAPGHVVASDMARAIQLVEHTLAGMPNGFTDPAEILYPALRELLRGVRISDIPESLEQYRIPEGATTLHMPENGWPAAFLEELSVWAIHHGTASLAVTPWRTLLVRGMSGTDQRDVLRICASERVSSRAPGWGQYLLCAAGLEQDANTLCDLLDNASPTNPGLAISLGSLDDVPSDTHFEIEKTRDRGPMGWRIARYALRCNGIENVRAERVERTIDGLRIEEVAQQIIAYMDLRFALREEIPADSTNENAMAPAVRDIVTHHTCVACFTVYDAAYGDSFGGIAPGTTFNSLPGSWVCPVCGALKESFSKPRLKSQADSRADMYSNAV